MKIIFPSSLRSLSLVSLILASGFVWCMTWLYVMLLFFFLSALFKVSWMRKRDLHILTSNNFLYTGDQRFSVIHPQDSDEWNLKIEYAQPKDAGVYECQVSLPRICLGIFETDLNLLLENGKYIKTSFLSLFPPRLGQYRAQNQLRRKFRCRK